MNLEVKSVSQLEGIVEAEASTVGIVDLQGEKMVPGAFTKTIKEAWNKVLLFLNHNHNEGKPPIGRVTEFLRMEGDKLVFKGRISKTQEGLDTLVLLADKVITELSVGFEVVKQRWNDGIREIQEVKLFEISFVNWGANPQTAVRYVKSADFVNKYIDFDGAVQRSEMMAVPERLINAFYRAHDSILYDGQIDDAQRYNALHDMLWSFNQKFSAWIEEAFRGGYLKESRPKLDMKGLSVTLQREGEPDPNHGPTLPPLSEADNEALLLFQISELDAEMQKMKKTMEV